MALQPNAGPGSNTGHGYVWDRPDGMRARCGGAAVCMQCATDHARWVTTLAKSGNVIGVVTPEDMANDPRAKQYRPAPPAVARAFDTTIAMLFTTLKEEGGADALHKAYILHSALMQTQNAVFRGCGAMSADGYIDGLANYVAQALSIGSPSAVEMQWAAFRVTLDALEHPYRATGDGAGIAQKKPQA